ncbi:MAG TPA: alanyl-tRNA editing protein, partial [Halobacteriales archaeon]|nr:alanyl-tRNA editing protein [Halobacteriales archaeon]
DDDLARIERLANEAISADYPVTKEERPRPEVEAETDEGRSLLHLIPDHVDPLRVVEIEGYDLCPCGGTHVDRLGEIGRIEIIDRTSKGKDTERVEFVLAEG